MREGSEATRARECIDHIGAKDLQRRINAWQDASLIVRGAAEGTPLAVGFPDHLLFAVRKQAATADREERHEIESLLLTIAARSPYWQDAVEETLDEISLQPLTAANTFAREVRARLRQPGSPGLTLLICLLFLLFSSFFSPLYAQPKQVPGTVRAHYLPIELANGDNIELLSGHKAVVVGYADQTIPEDVWLPSKLFDQLGLPVRPNATRRSFTVRVKNPNHTLELPTLALLSPGHLDLDFPARLDEGIWRFNISGMARICGLVSVLTERDTVLLFRADRLPREMYPERVTRKLKRPFNLAFDVVANENTDRSLEEKDSGPDVIAPIWFTLADETGTVLSKANPAYVEWEQRKGRQVWPVVTNAFQRDRTRKLLSNNTAQNLFIARLLSYARLYGFSGINIDFENVYDGDASRLSTFVRKFTKHARTMGLSVSINVRPPSRWSRCYQHRTLSRLVDYVMVMTYDEHWSASPKAGSTASLPWVKRGLAASLAVIPAEKLMLGIPFYTRLWEEGRSEGGGGFAIMSKTLDMKTSEQLLRESGAEKVWLTNTEQHYFEYRSGDRTHRVWMEDDRSMKLRMDLIKKNKLAGAAFWRLGFEKPEIWQTIKK